MRDLAAENSVLSCLFNYGRNYYIEVSDLLSPNCFTEQYNEIFYFILEHLFEEVGVEVLDQPAIYSAAQDLGLSHKLNTIECENHINQVIDFNADPSNLKIFAQRIKRLQIAREIKKSTEKVLEDLDELTGNESLSEIFAIPENAVFNLATSFGDQDGDPVALSDIVGEYITEKVENPVEQVGVSTGFSRFDESIGGGLRPGTVTVIGARAKNFKSGVAITISNHISNLGLPVLYMDTELQSHEQIPRLLAKHANTDIGDVETGKFNEDAVRHAAQTKFSPNLHHKSIAGMPFSEQLGIMRRWLFKSVGIQLDGKAKPAVIVYDYLKLMEKAGLEKMGEHQVLGFLLADLHNFALKYNVPILTFVQLNRDGISREDSAAIAQSDRILWFCSSFSILKRKIQEEVDMERSRGVPEDAIGNFKLIPIDCRHGPGVQQDDYISLRIIGSRFQISELGYYSELQNDTPESQPNAPNEYQF